MKLSLSNRSWTWIGAVALVLTVGILARHDSGRAKIESEELRDAVASPVPVGARPTASAGAFARVALPPRKPALSERLNRFADALDAKAESLRSTPSR
jgi:hypothetical protein